MNYFQTPFSTRFNWREYNNCIGTIRTNIKANRFGKNATHLRCPEALAGRTRFQIIIMICFYWNLVQSSQTQEFHIYFVWRPEPTSLAYQTWVQLKNKYKNLTHLTSKACGWGTPEPCCLHNESSDEIWRTVKVKQTAIYLYNFFIRSIAFFSNLETCAWEIPISSATSIWVLPSKKRFDIIVFLGNFCQLYLLCFFLGIFFFL